MNKSITQDKSDITWIKLLLEMLRTTVAGEFEITCDKIDEMVDVFMNAIPVFLQSKLQAHNMLNIDN